MSGTYRYSVLPTVMGIALSILSAHAYGVTADNVVCAGCVGTTDLANNAVTTPKIANNAVSNPKIANNAVTGAKIADGTITNADVSAAANIDILKILGAAGVEYASLGSCSNIGNSMTNCGSVAVTAPKAGYVVLTASAYAITFGQNTVVEFGVGTSANTFTNYTRAGELDGSDTIRRAHPLSVSAVVPVAAGTTTFYANAMRESVFDAQAVNLGNVYLTAVFVPKRY